MTETTGTLIDPKFKPVIAARVSEGLEFQPTLYIPADPSIIFLHAQDDRTELEFKKHEKQWKKDTMHVSSPFEKYLHQSYARIIGLGWPVVRLILLSLKSQPADWFYALRAITGENPVPDSAAGDVRKMSEIWVKWGAQKGIV